MGFAEAIKSGFSNYLNFSDRSQRSAFWYWQLFYLIVYSAVLALDFSVLRSFSSSNAGFGPLTGIFYIATLLPSIAVMFRRLHDTGRSAWWELLWFVPVIGWIILIVWHCQRGEAGPNKYGPNPLG